MIFQKNAACPLGPSAASQQHFSGSLQHSPAFKSTFYCTRKALPWCRLLQPNPCFFMSLITSHTSPTSSHQTVRSEAELDKNPFPNKCQLTVVTSKFLPEK